MAECAFDLALAEWADREWEELANTPEFETSKKHERAMERIFKRYDRNTRKLRSRLDTKVGSVTKKVLIAVLAIFLALIAGCSAAYFISHSFRNTVYPDCVEIFLYNGTDNYTTTFENTYYLSDLPEDYTIIRYNNTYSSKSLLYQNTKTGKLVMFKYGVKSDYCYPIYFDTESGKLSEIEINGSIGLCYENDKMPQSGINNLFGSLREKNDNSKINACIWDNGDYIFEVYSDLTKKDTLDLAKSSKVL